VVEARDVDRSGVVWGHWGHACFIEVPRWWMAGFGLFGKGLGTQGWWGKVWVVWPGDERDGCCDEEGGGPFAAVDITGRGKWNRGLFGSIQLQDCGIRKDGPCAVGTQ
jgi:hypothetical protein